MRPDQLEREHTLATAAARLDELRKRESFSVTAEELEADGVLPGPGVFRDALSAAEALELLALTEVVARKAAYGRQLTVRSARAAGASWAQIGTALGTSRQAAWETHRRWLAASGNEGTDDGTDDAADDAPDDAPDDGPP